MYSEFTYIGNMFRKQLIEVVQHLIKNKLFLIIIENLPEDELVAVNTLIKNLHKAKRFAGFKADEILQYLQEYPKR